MDHETIYLDNDEEITSVVDKLKGTEHVSVDLVIPKDALMTQSVVNLKILKKQAESLGKEITIVTQDKVGKKLASQLGIPTVDKPGEEPKEVRMAEKEPPKPEKEVSDIELKEGKPEPKSAVEDDEIPIEMKPGAEGIVTPTSEVVGGATTERVDETEPTGAKEISSDKIKDPAKEKSKKKRRMQIIGIAGGFLALTGLVAGYILVPMANITLTLAAEKQKVDFNFTADKSVSSIDNGTQTIPAREISEDIEKSEKYQATGKKKVGEKATGTITVTNKVYNSDFIMVAGTRFVSPAGLVFKSKTNVTVPKYSNPFGGPETIGKIDVSVEAESVGENYNIGASHFTIPAMNSSNVYGDSSAAMTGGTSRDVTYVTQTDVNTAKEEIKKVIESETKKIILEKTEREERWLEGALKITEISANPSVAVNGEATEFELKTKSNVKALVFKNDDLKKLAETTLGDQIGSGKEIVESEGLTSGAELVKADIDKNQIQARLSGEAYIAVKLDQNKMRVELSGLPESKTYEYLKGQEGITDVQIVHFPSFYKRMPRIEKNIKFKITISKTQE